MKGRVMIVKILITAVKDIDRATSPLANEVRILEVAPPGAAASIITPIANSGDKVLSNPDVGRLFLAG